MRYKRDNIGGVFSDALIAKKIRYDTLYKTSFRFFKKDDCNEINIFFNLAPLCHRFHNSPYMEQIMELDNKRRYSLAAELFNWCAHYRHFYWSRFQIHTSFYLYYTYQEPTRKEVMYNGYMREYTEKNSLVNPEYGVINNIVHDNLELASTISEYLPHIYVFNTYDFDIIGLPTLFISRLRKVNPHCANLLFTNCEFDYLAMKHPYTRVAINSEYGLLRRDEVYSYISFKGKLVTQMDGKDTSIQLGFDYLPYILALKGNKKYGINPVKGYSTFLKALKFIDQCKNEYHILGDKPPADIAIFLEGVKDYLKEDQIQQFIKNYQIISPSNYEMFLSDITNQRIEQKFIDLEDNQSIMNLNQTYFPYNNIQLLELMEGEYRILGNSLVKL